MTDESTWHPYDGVAYVPVWLIADPQFSAVDAAIYALLTLWSGEKTPAEYATLVPCSEEEARASLTQFYRAGIVGANERKLPVLNGTNLQVEEETNAQG